jgi:hypothetical protein
VLHADLRGYPTKSPALRPHPTDIAVDNTSLAAYLDGANALGVAASPIANRQSRRRISASTVWKRTNKAA